MPEGLFTAEVAKNISEHRAHAEQARSRADWLAIGEAVLPSLVAVLAAWSRYSAAKWSTEAPVRLAKASAMRTEANRALGTATQIRIFDSVSFNAVVTTYTAGDRAAFRLTTRRLRPGYRAAFSAWLATHPLENPHAPPDPSYLPQYRIPQEAQGRALDAKAETHFKAGQAAGATGDRYVRLTVLLATVLFLVGISGHFPVRAARVGLLGVACVLLALSAIGLLDLPGPPA